LILVGDAGGTKTRLALYHAQHEVLSPQEIETYVSREYGTIDELIRAYLDSRQVEVEAVCIGVPGPVIEGEAKTTNLPWTVNDRELSRLLRNVPVILVNDLVATCAAIPHLSTGDVLVLHKGDPKKPASVYGVLAPGTGLGQAFLFTESGKEHILASEGGHADFAPRTDIETELLRFLKVSFGRVSYERVLSGQGLLNIYDFLKKSGFAVESEALRKRMKAETPAAVIAEEGQEGTCKLCVKALDIFASVLGAHAGNLALTLLATGGIFLGGGIPAKIAGKLSDGTAVEGYLDKGRLSTVVRGVPLSVIRDDHTALHGAARIARKTLGQ
jgi:glucokinase